LVVSSVASSHLVHVVGNAGDWHNSAVSATTSASSACIFLMQAFLVWRSNALRQRFQTRQAQLGSLLLTQHEGVAATLQAAHQLILQGLSTDPQICGDSLSTSRPGIISSCNKCSSLAAAPTDPTGMQLMELLCGWLRAEVICLIVAEAKCSSCTKRLSAQVVNILVCWGTTPDALCISCMSGLITSQGEAGMQCAVGMLVCCGYAGSTEPGRSGRLATSYPGRSRRSS